MENPPNWAPNAAHTLILFSNIFHPEISGGQRLERGAKKGDINNFGILFSSAVQWYF